MFSFFLPGLVIGYKAPKVSDETLLVYKNKHQIIIDGNTEVKQIDK